MYLKFTVQREHFFLRSLSLRWPLNLKENRPYRVMGFDTFPRASNEMPILSVVGKKKKSELYTWSKNDSWYFIISQLIPLIAKSNI